MNRVAGRCPLRTYEQSRRARQSPFRDLGPRPDEGLGAAAPRGQTGRTRHAVVRVAVRRVAAGCRRVRRPDSMGIYTSLYDTDPLPEPGEGGDGPEPQPADVSKRLVVNWATPQPLGTYTPGGPGG